MFDEIKRIAQNFVDECERLGIKLKRDMTLNEVIEILREEDSDYLSEYESDYYYSIYNSELLEVLAQNIELLYYCQDVEADFGQSCIQNPMLINVAIYNYLMDEYSDYTLEELDIDIKETDDEEEDF